MDGLQQRVQLGEASLVPGLLGVPAEVQVRHDLGQELRPEAVRLDDGLDVLDDQQPPRFDAWEPKEDRLDHVLAEVGAVVDDDLQGRGVGPVHLGRPNTGQPSHVGGVPAVQPLLVQQGLVVDVLLRKVAPRPLALLPWAMLDATDLHAVELGGGVRKECSVGVKPPTVVLSPMSFINGV